MCEELNRKEFHEAIDTTLSGLQADPWLAQRVVNRERTSEPVMKKKLSIGTIIIILSVILTTVTAFALTKGFGLLNFFTIDSKKEVPENFEQYIMHNLGTITTDHFTVNIREGYFDGKTVHLIYDIVPKNKNILLLSNGSSIDESWYSVTHLQYDQQQDDGTTVLDYWNESSYTSIWIVDISVETNENTQHSENAVLNEETGILTGQIQFPFSQLKTERTILFNFQAAPLTDVHIMESIDYDHADHNTITLTLHAVYSGEEQIFSISEPISIASIGIQIDDIRFIVLPNEIQYQINYSETYSARYKSFEPLSFRFVELNEDGTIRRFLNEGMSNKFNGIGNWIYTGSLGVSEIAGIYSLAIYTDASEIPLEIVSFQVRHEDNQTWTSEERVWQQESDRSKQHNEADDTLVNPGDGDLPVETAISIAKNAILDAYSLPIDALDNAQIITDLYVTNNRPDYRRWLVRFAIRRDDNWLEREYWCIVDSSGEVIEDPDLNEPSLQYKAKQWKADDEIITAYKEYSRLSGYKPFWMWPYELKANCSNRLKELYEISNNQSYHQDIVACLEHTFIIPDTDHIQYDDALGIAITYISEMYKLNVTAVTEFQVKFESYMNIAEKETWVFILSDGSDYDSLHYLIMLDGFTGSIISCDEVKWWEIYDEDTDNLFLLKEQ